MNDIQKRIDEIVQSHKVVLFMKGTRMAPQCAFSTQALQTLRRCGAEVEPIDVLADPDLREGLKEYSNWPTFPQAYIDGELVGGSDLLAELYETGELQKKLGTADDSAEDDAAKPPSVTITAAARKAFEAAREQHCEPGEVLRLEVKPPFRCDLFFGSKREDDFVVDCGGLSVHVSPRCAPRADGTTIDFVDGPEGMGFAIENPNAPAR